MSLCDPYLNPDYVYSRLSEEYLKHKSLVIALDYDNTIFDYHKKGFIFEKVIKLIKVCNDLKFKIVIFSGSAKERHDEIYKYCETIGIKIDGINEDVIDWNQDKTLDWSKSKIYYNIFLDDRAGLLEAYTTLNKLVTNILLHNEN